MVVQAKSEYSIFLVANKMGANKMGAADSAQTGSITLVANIFDFLFLELPCAGAGSVSY